MFRRRTNELFAFQKTQEMPRPVQQRRGKARETTDFDAVGSVGTPRFQPVNEENAVAHLSHRNVEVSNRGQLVGQLRELVVVRRENGFAPRLIVKMLGDGPRDGDAVVRRSSAAN